MEQDYRYQQERGNQTPPGARRQLNHASVFRRIGAYLIDGLLLSLIIGLIMGAGFFTGLLEFPEIVNGDPDMTGIYFSSFYLFLLLLSALIPLTYFTYFESKSGGGATFAKRLLSIQVVDEYGRNVSTVNSFIRNIARWLWNIPCIGFIILIVDVALIATNDQRIGDTLAGTYVVKEEAGSIYRYSRFQGADPQGYQRQEQPQGQYQQSQPLGPSQQSQRSPLPDEQEETMCPDCGTPMKYIEQSQQWYCYSCGEYK